MTLLQTAGEIAQELSTIIATIRKANGYETDIGVKVMRGKRKIEDDEVPCVSIVEGDDNVNQGKSKREPSAEIDQQYMLVGYSPCDPNNPNDEAHRIIRDLKRAIFKEPDGPNSFAKKVRDVQYKGRDIGARADGTAIVMGVIEITVTYVERLDQP